MLDLKTVNQGPAIFPERYYCRGSPPSCAHANSLKHSPLQDYECFSEIHDSLFDRLTFNGPQLHVRNSDVATV